MEKLEKPNRVGTLYEYKKEHYYLSIADFHDGHYEIEIHRCFPEPLYHSCDPKDIDDANEKFERLFSAEVNSRKANKSGMAILALLEENEAKILGSLSENNDCLHAT